MAKVQRTTYIERVDAVQYCIAHSYDYVKTAEKYSISYQQIYRWVKGYEDRGIQALQDGRGRGRGSNAKMSEVEKLRAENLILKAEVQRANNEAALLRRLMQVESVRQ